MIKLTRAAGSFELSHKADSIEDFIRILSVSVVGWCLKSREEDGTLGGEFQPTSVFDGTYYIDSGCKVVWKYGSTYESVRTQQALYVLDGVIYDSKDEVTHLLEAEGFTFSDFF